MRVPGSSAAVKSSSVTLLKDGAGPVPDHKRISINWAMAGKFMKMALLGPLALNTRPPLIKRIVHGVRRISNCETEFAFKLRLYRKWRDVP